MRKKDQEKLKEISKKLRLIFDDLGNFRGIGSDLTLWRSRILLVYQDIDQYLEQLN